jgi:hypothetical protein
MQQGQCCSFKRILGKLMGSNLALELGVEEFNAVVWFGHVFLVINDFFRYSIYRDSYFFCSLYFVGVTPLICLNARLNGPMEPYPTSRAMLRTGRSCASKR